MPTASNSDCRSPRHRRLALRLAALAVLAATLDGCYMDACYPEFARPESRKIMCGPGSLGTGGNFVIRPAANPGEAAPAAGEGTPQSY